jgi:hypothetical protein
MDTREYFIGRIVDATTEFTDRHAVCRRTRSLVKPARIFVEGEGGGHFEHFHNSEKPFSKSSLCKIMYFHELLFLIPVNTFINFGSCEVSSAYRSNR